MIKIARHIAEQFFYKVKSMEKTNVMRILDLKKIAYKPLCFETDTAISGVDMADRLNIPHESTFKTLVTVGASRKNYVFMIPVEEELDLKKCAKAVNEKNIEMIKSKDLLPLTGYVHGGCSPIGMKKPFKTVISKTANNYEKIVFSAGKIGYMVEVDVNDALSLISFTFGDVTKNNE